MIYANPQNTITPDWGTSYSCFRCNLLLQTPEATRSIDEVMESPSKLEGREIAIRGEVLDYSIDDSNSTFIIHGEVSTAC